jgi:hypothetical protein
MPREWTASEEREYDDYRQLGPVNEVKSRLGKLTKVQGEAAEQRKRIETLEKENAGLVAKIPEGAVVLTGDDAKAHAEIVAAGKTLKDYAGDAKRLSELEAKDATREREDSVRKAAKAEGLDPDRAVKAFANLAGADALTFEDGEVQVQGKQEKQPAGYVTVDGKKQRLGEWLSSEHPYLNLATGNGNGSDGGVREVPEMRGGGPAPAGNVYDRIRASVKKEQESAGTPTVDTLAKRLGGVSVG